MHPQRSSAGLAFAGGLLAEIVVQRTLPGSGLVTATLAFWNGYALVYLAAIWFTLPRKDPAQMALLSRVKVTRWTRLWHGGSLNLGVVQFGSAVALVAAGWALPRATGDDTVLVVLGATGVLLAWFASHTAYAWHYAGIYFRTDPAAGLSFPGTENVRFIDFAYFSFAVGSTFGTTDVTVVTSGMRRTVLAHGIFSFLFNTVILALLITFLTG